MITLAGALLPAFTARIAQALPADPFGQLLVAIVVAGAVVLVGRVLLSLAWKLLMMAAVVVTVLYAASLAGAGLF